MMRTTVGYVRQRHLHHPRLQMDGGARLGAGSRFHAIRFNWRGREMEVERSCPLCSLSHLNLSAYSCESSHHHLHSRLLPAAGGLAVLQVHAARPRKSRADPCAGAEMMDSITLRRMEYRDWHRHLKRYRLVARRPKRKPGTVWNWHGSVPWWGNPRRLAKQDPK
jgi:hypothetical protein